MQITSALSTLSSPPAIAQDIEGQIRSALRRSPDLLLLFISYTLAEHFDALVSMLRQSLGPTQLLAVAAESIIGADKEIERAPAVSALAFILPGATLHTFHMAQEEWQDLLSDEEFFATRVSNDAEDVRASILFVDPFTTPILQLLEAHSARFPNAPVIGGMASGMQNAGDTRLALNDAIHTSGLVGLSFAGDIAVDCVVSQGCRPIGETMVITKCKTNVIEQLDGKPALAAIEEMVNTLELHDRELLATGGLQIGRAIDEGKGNLGRGDFLIRSLIGVRRESGAILIGDLVRPGLTLQFHVRDGPSADEEMRLLLEGQNLLTPSATHAAGALLITCNGRGTRLFDQPHHDVTLIRQVLGDIPIAGFFAAGELGPVGRKNFIHGQTAALAIFRSPSPPA